MLQIMGVIPVAIAIVLVAYMVSSAVTSRRSSGAGGNTNLKGRVCLVAGADSGAGHEIVSELASAGARLVLVGSRRGVLESLVSVAYRRGGEAVSAALPSLEPGYEAAATRLALAAYGRVDALILNGSAALAAPFDEWKGSDACARVLSRQIGTPIRLAHALLPELRQTRGAIVHVAYDGTDAQPCSAALAAFFDAVSGEGSSVRISTVTAGAVTGLTCRPSGSLAVPQLRITPDGGLRTESGLTSGRGAPAKAVAREIYQFVNSESPMPSGVGCCGARRRVKSGFGAVFFCCSRSAVRKKKQ